MKTETHKKNILWSWRQRLEWYSCKLRTPKIANKPPDMKKKQEGFSYRFQKEHGPANFDF